MLKRLSLQQTRSAPVFQKVIMIGPTGVGKTTLAHTFIFGDDKLLKATKSDSKLPYLNKVIVVDGVDVLIEIIDMNSEEDFATVQDVDGILCVFSITDAESFQATEKLRNPILQANGMQNKPMMLVGNKCELEDDRQVTFEEASARGQQWGASYVETSAKTRENFDKVFAGLMRQIRLHKRKMHKMKNGKAIMNAKRNIECLLL